MKHIIAILFFLTSKTVFAGINCNIQPINEDGSPVKDVNGQIIELTGLEFASSKKEIQGYVVKVSDISDNSILVVKRKSDDGKPSHTLSIYVVSQFDVNDLNKAPNGKEISSITAVDTDVIYGNVFTGENTYFVYCTTY